MNDEAELVLHALPFMTLAEARMREPPAPVYDTWVSVVAFGRS
jgi:hypothetical protein